MANRLGFEDYRVKVLPEKKRLFSIPGQGMLSSVINVFTGESHVSSPVEVLLPDNSEGIFTRMPFDIEIE